MKKLGKTIVVTLALLALASCARNDTKYISINESLNTAEAKQVIDPKIKLYFGKDAPGQVLQRGVTTKRTTNAVLKEDFNTCTRAFLSGIIALQNRARTLGATKVTNIVSNYKAGTTTPAGQYQCHVGNIVTGVALKADIKK